MNEQQRDTQSDAKAPKQDASPKAAYERRAGESVAGKLPPAYALQQAARMVAAGVPLGVLPREALKGVVHSLGNSVTAGVALKEMQMAELNSQELPEEFIGSEAENTVKMTELNSQEPPQGFIGR